MSFIDVEELERSGTIAKLKITPCENSGRFSILEEDFLNFKTKLNQIEINSTNNQKAGFYLNICKVFTNATKCKASDAFVKSIMRSAKVPHYWYKTAKGYLFIAWVLNLPDDYVIPMQQFHRVSVKATPSSAAPVPVQSVLDGFLEAHQDEIQGPIIEAWKQITSFYNIDVVLEALHRMGLNDAAIAALSKAASK